ncbi:uncharacterized protein [Aegilops tauschii subsp. strangulata]|uniref:uncharacterized protein n=1 Tax=Aegilops tauschii subsp. strangulata TaxID=200361 RepID=UPI003CC8D3ED
MAMSNHAAAAGGGPVVMRRVERSLQFRRCGQPPLVTDQPYLGRYGSYGNRFIVTDLSTLQSDGACRRALRRMLAELPQLRALRLTQDEWDDVVTANVVPQIVRVACGNGATRGFTFRFEMEVDRQFIYDERALLMACKERELGGGGRPDKCPICLVGLEGEPAVQPPRCPHTFHRRCILMWFCKATTCPICRCDVRFCALPEFLAL